MVGLPAHLGGGGGRGVASALGCAESGSVIGPGGAWAPSGPAHKAAAAQSDAEKRILLKFIFLTAPLISGRPSSRRPPPTGIDIVYGCAALEKRCQDGGQDRGWRAGPPGGTDNPVRADAEGND